ncbi:hypothetical protein JOD54_000275 [Actinokineospora baliensis]|uniref:hypothetical protein n=1 Tax=Actinokineospora baliensis TaxID=547056 RepID=UPI00195832F0|nr:hypothetical protein [Actinokineospora baliensis]MBM7770071.1 hypothetical protein [Actinokineospora baliensis]
MSTIAPAAPVAAPRFTVRALVPGALLVLLLLAYASMLPMAPILADPNGISELTITRGPDRAEIPGESLDCAPEGARTVCTVDVLDRPLRVAITPPESGSVQCFAEYAGRSRGCSVSYNRYPIFPAGANLADDLGFSAAEFDQIAAEAMPWWRLDNGLPLALPVVLLMCPLAAALVVGLSSRRSIAHPRLWVAGVGVGWVALHVGILAVVNTTMFDLVQPVLVVAAVLMFWQWALTRPGWRTGWVRAITAFLVTTVACFVSMFVFLFAAMYID